VTKWCQRCNRLDAVCWAHISSDGVRRLACRDGNGGRFVIRRRMRSAGRVAVRAGASATRTAEERGWLRADDSRRPTGPAVTSDWHE